MGSLLVRILALYHQKNTNLAGYWPNYQDTQ
jgi:hypothetical protein